VALLGVCAVGTHKSSCTTRPITPFFILEAFGTQRVTGHVITSEPSQQGGEIRSCKTRGGTGALLNKETGSRAMRHVAE
jgi:hypothetical protein